MCWVGKLSDKRKLSKEEATKKCYKIVENDLKSVWQEFQYEIGKTYSIPHLKPKKAEDWRIRLGLGDIEIYEGFHFYLADYHLTRIFGDYSATILICEIPEDAECYVNTNSCEGVTNKIVIREAIPYEEILKERNESNNS